MLFGGVQVAGRPDMENVRRLDLLPIPMITRMERLGIAIDIPHFHQLTSDLEAEMVDLRREIACEIPSEKLDMFCAMSDADDDTADPINVESGPQIAKLMFDVLGVGRGMDLKKTANGERLSTGKKQLELLKQEHEVVGLVLKYRERSKLRNTYTKTLPIIAKHHPKGDCPICELRHAEATHRVHTEFTTTRAATGRLASKRPNLQNIPARTPLGRRVRAGFIASPGSLLLSRDFSQIELRLLAHAATELALIDIFIRKLDPHLMTAMLAFQITDPKKVDKLLHRAPCKNVNFGIVYGLSQAGLYDQMAMTYATAGVPLPEWLTVDWCEKFIADWFRIYPGVRGYMDLQYYRARRYGMVWDLFGRIRRVPEVRSALPWIRSAGLRQAGNMPIQSDGAGLMKLAMGETDQQLRQILDSGIWCWPLLSIHDEMIIEVEEDYADAVGQIVGEIMDGVMTDKQTGENLCRVPIQSDGHSMLRWVKD